MTTERMLELIILNKFMDRYNNMSSQVKTLTCKTISISEMEERRLLLEEEFLEPYVIDNAPKGD
jgi:hypothetical protein